MALIRRNIFRVPVENQGFLPGPSRRLDFGDNQHLVVYNTFMAKHIFSSVIVTTSARLRLGVPEKCYHLFQDHIVNQCETRDWDTQGMGVRQIESPCQLWPPDFVNHVRVVPIHHQITHLFTEDKRNKFSWVNGENYCATLTSEREFNPSGTLHLVYFCFLDLMGALLNPSASVLMGSARSSRVGHQGPKGRTQAESKSSSYWGKGHRVLVLTSFSNSRRPLYSSFLAQFPESKSQRTRKYSAIDDCVASIMSSILIFVFYKCPEKQCGLWHICL